MKKILALAAFAAFATAALAQGFGGGQGRGGFMMGGPGGSSLMLLGREDVQGELKVTDEQKGKLDSIRAGIRDRMRSLFQNGGFQPGGDMSEMQKAMGKLMAEISNDAVKVLTPEQAKRLKELNVQASGNAVVLQEDVAKDLAITEDQKGKLADLQKTQQEATMGVIQKMRDGEISQEDLPGIFEKNRKVMDDEIGKILTDDQKKKLKDMAGKPFEFKDPKPGAFPTRRGGGL